MCLFIIVTAALFILFSPYPPYSQHHFLEEGVAETEHAEGEEPEVGEVIGVVTVGDFIRGIGPRSGGHCAIVGPGAEGEDDEEHGPMEVVER